MANRDDPEMPKKNTDVALHLEEYVPGLLLWLSNKLTASASQIYRQKHGLGIVEWRILSYLAVYEWGTGAQMSQLMGSDKAAISRGAAILQTKKLIRSRAGFGRNLEFGLTAKGRDMHDRIVPLALAREKALLSGLDERDRAALIGYLQVLLGNLAKVDAIDSDAY